jgi:hypothetical protein
VAKPPFMTANRMWAVVVCVERWSELEQALEGWVAPVSDD